MEVQPPEEGYEHEIALNIGEPIYDLEEGMEDGREGIGKALAAGNGHLSSNNAAADRSEAPAPGRG